MNKLIICIDYDGTFSAIPELLTDLIVGAKKAGHRVICATMRYEYEGKEVLESIGKLCEVIFTSRKAKLAFLKELGIEPNIWIDDLPMFLFRDGQRGT